jgi:hypothetical protein
MSLNDGSRQRQPQPHSGKPRAFHECHRPFGGFAYLRQQDDRRPISLILPAAVLQHWVFFFGPFLSPDIAEANL